MARPNEKLRAARLAMASRADERKPMSRTELAELVNEYLWAASGRRRHYSLSEHALGRYERGEIHWPSSAYRTGLRAVLNRASDAELGFWPTPRGRVPEQPGDPLSGYGLRPAFDHSVPTVITPEHVGRVRAITRAIALSENMFGGGLPAATVDVQISWVKGLLRADAPADLREALLEAAGNLGGVAAFAAFDTGDHRSADQHFRFALWCAGEAKSWSLRANVLAEMSRKSLYLGELDQALSLIEFAQVRQDRVSATAQAMMSALRARTLALSGRHREATDEVGRADDVFAARDPRIDPPWLCYYDEAEHLGSTARALIPAARRTGKAQAAAGRLKEAIRLHSPEYPRSRTFSRTRLANLLMMAGDPHEAALIGTQALTDAAALSSERVAAEMRQLGQASKQHATIGAVAELREGIAALPQSIQPGS